MTELSDNYLVSILNGRQAAHLALDRRGISAVGDLSALPGLNTLDLRDNLIFSACGLREQSTLTHLYLQGNRLKDLEGIGCLASLRVLYLDRNSVEVLEKLEACPLQVLSLRGQILEDGQRLAFDPRCLSALRGTLEAADFSRNRLASASPLSGLTYLERLDVSGNRIGDISSFIRAMSAMPRLRELDVGGNPIAERPAHAKEIIAACRGLGKLSGRVVTPKMRSCCEVMAAGRCGQKSLPFLRECFDQSVSSLPTTFRPHLNEKFVNEIRVKIE